MHTAVHNISCFLAVGDLILEENYFVFDDSVFIFVNLVGVHIWNTWVLLLVSSARRITVAHFHKL